MFCGTQLLALLKCQHRVLNFLLGLTKIGILGGRVLFWTNMWDEQVALNQLISIHTVLVPTVLCQCVALQWGDRIMGFTPNFVGQILYGRYAGVLE